MKYEIGDIVLHNNMVAIVIAHNSDKTYTLHHFGITDRSAPESTIAPLPHLEPRKTTTK